jgi:hypothetical protein
MKALSRGYDAKEEAGEANLSWRRGARTGRAMALQEVEKIDFPPKHAARGACWHGRGYFGLEVWPPRIAVSGPQWRRKASQTSESPTD